MNESIIAVFAFVSVMTFGALLLIHSVLRDIGGELEGVRRELRKLNAQTPTTTTKE